MNIPVLLTTKNSCFENYATIKPFLLEYPMKSGILEVQRRGNLADSDLRLQACRYAWAEAAKTVG
jgi:hypothetical protein